VDKLQPYLATLTARPSYKILIADPDANAFVMTRGIKITGEIAIIPEDELNDLKKVVPRIYGPSVVPENLNRLCSFIAFDDQTILLQDKGSLERASLLKDKTQVQSIIREYDKQANKLLKRGRAGGKEAPARRD
jgi:hypothetical protein